MATHLKRLLIFTLAASTYIASHLNLSKTVTSFTAWAFCYVMPSENVAKLELYSSVNLHAQLWYSCLSYNYYILGKTHEIKNLSCQKTTVLLY